MRMYEILILGAFPAFLVYAQDVSVSRRPTDVYDLRAQIHSQEDFISHLVIGDRPVREEDIFSNELTEDGKRVIIGGGVMAVPDECSPRNMTVRLPLDYSDPYVTYYPDCTMVERCGGCCPTQFLSCEPRYKERLVLKVLKARYRAGGSVNMQWTGFHTVEVERHLSCQAVCRLTAEDCNPNQIFLQNQCRCQCRPEVQQQQCLLPRRWDPNTCGCRCLFTMSCCDERESRRCPLFFDHNVCTCSPKSTIGANVNVSQAQIDAWLAANDYNVSGMSHLLNNTRISAITPTDPTTTTTTTTTTATALSGCGHITCPFRLTAVRDSQGTCRCQIVSRRGRYPSRRRGQ